jgi:hypothetical protein
MGDRLLEVSGQPVATAQDALKRFQEVSAQNQSFPLRFSREGQEQTTQITPKYLEALKRPAVGVSVSSIGTVSFPWYQASA